ncbi:MAG: alkaline phosphatase family protein [Acidobacteria bacterium]|nr:alkaline phosphatase family protein [Acidobacteriota bacterium]
MRRHAGRAWLWVAILSALFVGAPGAWTVARTAQGPGRSGPEPPRRHLIIVVDGLRPDYVTAAVMPSLTTLARRGVTFTRHHSVYPTVTRVNAASFSTGAYPERHGLLGNAVFFPRVDATRFLDTADRHALDRIVDIDAPLLTAHTLAETLEQAGRKMLVVSSGSAGSAVLNNHTVAGGAILHHAFTRPSQLGEAMQRLGPVPATDAPRPAFDRYAVDAFLEVGIPRVDPTVTVLWLGALDSTAHEHGPGDPQTVEVLRKVDAEIARVQAGLSARGLLDHYTIWVTSDHGFSTHTGSPDFAAVLGRYAGARADGTPRVVASGGAIYVRDNDEPTVTGIVRALQQTRGIGAIFTRAITPGALDGVVPGTLSFDAVRWQHARSAQILYSPDWTDAANANGVRGTTAAGGTAGHGSSSPWDIHNTLIAAGPDLRRDVVSDAPSANVDLAPTMLGLLGIAAPPSMQGRVLREGFAARAGADVVTAPAVTTSEHTARTADGAYAATVMFSTVQADGKAYRYVDGTRVVRK